MITILKIGNEEIALAQTKLAHLDELFAMLQGARRIRQNSTWTPDGVTPSRHESRHVTNDEVTFGVELLPESDVVTAAQWEQIKAEVAASKKEMAKKKGDKGTRTCDRCHHDYTELTEGADGLCARCAAIEKRGPNYTGL